MSKVQMVRALVNQRLTAAAEEIFGLFERTIAEYEEELCRSKEKNQRQQKLLDAVLKPEVRLHRADIQQLLVVKEEVPPEQQEWSPSLDQEDPPEPPHIKEEQEELWISQEGEQLQGLEEADVTKFLFTPVPVKSEDDEEKPQSSQLHQRQTEQMETGADGEDCGGPEPARNSHPDPELGPVTEDETEEYRCEPGDSDDWSPNIKVYKRQKRQREKVCGCSVCGRQFSFNSNLTRHMKLHTRDKAITLTPPENSGSDTICTSGDRPFVCSLCGKGFHANHHLARHTLVHSEERAFSCTGCDKRFKRKSDLTDHLPIHKGVKQFCCSFCGRGFHRKRQWRAHVGTHRGEKRFCCKVCDRTFTWPYEFRRHQRCCIQSPEQQQNQTEENREAEPWAARSTETGADGEDCGGPEPARNSLDIEAIDYDWNETVSVVII